ncbi:putative uncharacterized protein C3orf49 [Pristis pectinata]|uniref:putative uncharacterized protein C3orf49 n=1 Tax=Pristis pectinata TaxID=685728 RepID=UPI00223CB664|nr:putative uncharacterized protein C3orf49 [Pristis pectinata]
MHKNHRSCFPSQQVYNQDLDYSRIPKGEKEALEHRDKGIVRRHRDASTSLVKAPVFIPEDELSIESGSEYSEGKKKGLISKMRKTLERFVGHHYQHKQLKNFNKKIERNCRSGNSRTRNLPRFPVKCDHFLRTSKITDSPQKFLGKKTPNRLQNSDSYSFRSIDNTPSTTQAKQLANIDENKILATFKAKLQKTARIHVDVDVVEAETASIIGNNLIVRSRRMSRRVSVTSLSADQQKVVNTNKRQYFKIFKKKKKKEMVQNRHSFLTVGKLQAQVNDLIETASDKSLKLLAQRHAELQQCEYLGDEILQSSKQFQRVSKKSARKTTIVNGGIVINFLINP